jgi:hypothetical protein
MKFNTGAPAATELKIGNVYPAQGRQAGTFWIGIGGKVRLLKSIWDDGEGHHPPGWLANKGEVLTIKKVDGTSLAVAHEGAEGAFIIWAGEYENA